MVRRLLSARNDPQWGELMQNALLASKEAVWTDDAEGLERARTALGEMAKRAGAERVVSAISAVDAAVSLSDDRLGPEALTTLDVEVARFAADGDPRETLRYLIQPMLTRSGFLTRTGDLPGAFEMFKQVRDAAQSLPATDPISIAAEHVLGDSTELEARGRGMEDLWEAVFGPGTGRG